MAWGVFTFTKEGRARLAVVLRSLLIAQLLVSLSMIIFCYNESLRVLLLLKDIHKVTVVLLDGLILLQAYAMKLHYTSGLKLISVLTHIPFWTRGSVLAPLWMCTGCLVSINGMMVYAACHNIMTALMKDLSSSLKVGISQYLLEPSWKKLLDTMQIELSCCGVEMPSDWHEIAWLNVDFLDEHSELVNKLTRPDGKILPPVAPYSCCTPRVLAACYHDPIQQTEWREVWSDGSPLLSASLHARGCLEAIRLPLNKAILGLQWFNLLVVVLQIIVVPITRLLHTSSRDAVLSGESSGPGRGYLVGRLTPEQRIQPSDSWSDVASAATSGETTPTVVALLHTHSHTHSHTHAHRRRRRHTHTRPGSTEGL